MSPRRSSSSRYGGGFAGFEARTRNLPNLSLSGVYPSDRRFGSSVHRSVIEKYDMDSDWVKWRKGFEYYIKAAWDELVVPNPLYGQQNRLEPSVDMPEYVRAELDSVLYQGTPYELPTRFYGWEFPTQDADTNTHYVAKRVRQKDSKMGFITEVWRDPIKYKQQKEWREIWCKGQVDEDARLLLQMPGERITDGETEATLKTVLTEEGLPAIYKGKTFASSFRSDEAGVLDPTVITLQIPIKDIVVSKQEEETVVASQGLRKIEVKPMEKDPLLDPKELIGKIIYVQNFFTEKPVSDLQGIAWVDSTEYFGCALLDEIKDASVYCISADSETLPPSMYDITTLPNIFKAANATINVSGTYVFQKKQYQKYYYPTALTAQTVEKAVADMSYAILPFRIESAGIKDGVLTLTSVPFTSEVKFYPQLTPQAILVFSDYSFCKYAPDEQREGWTTMNTDVLPWQDEVFTTGKMIQVGDTYTCSCPNHSHAILAAPQADEDLGTRKQNRQRRYPLPSVMGLDRWEALGVEQAAGRFVSWESTEHRNSLRLCKHAIAARFVEKLRVIEPSKYPSMEARQKFEMKLEKDVEKFAYDFRLSYRRSQLSLSEIVFALAQGLNLDGVETAYVLFNTY